MDIMMMLQNASEVSEFESGYLPRKLAQFV
jgi:hypothetical protein